MFYQTLSHRLTENPPPRPRQGILGPLFDLPSLQCHVSPCRFQWFLLPQVLLSSTSAQQDHRTLLVLLCSVLLLKSYTRRSTESHGLHLMDFPCLWDYSLMLPCVCPHPHPAKAVALFIFSNLHLLRVGGIFLRQLFCLGQKQEFCFTITDCLLKIFENYL